MLADALIVSMALAPARATADYWIERLLRNWVSFMHGESKPDGLPDRASGGATCYTSLDLDNVAAYENLDRDLAEKTNAVIDSLVPAERCAVYHRYLHAVFRFPRGDVDSLLARAKVNLEAGLRRRGVWLGE
jgi:hypothetical protein